MKGALTRLEKPAILSRVRVLLLVCSAVSALVVGGAESPARFLAVETWRGSFGQDMSVAGSRTYQQTTGGFCTVDFSLVHHMDVSNVVLSNIFFGFGYWLSDGARIENGGNIAERFTMTCPDNPPSSREQTQRADGGAAQGIFHLQIDPATNQYVVQFGVTIADITIITPEGTFPGPELMNAWGPPITNALPTNGLTLRGSATIRLDQFPWAIFLPVPLSPADMQEVLHSSDLVLTWNLEPYVEDLEVIVEVEEYEKWLPEGNLKNPTERGNLCKLSAKLQKRGGGATTARAEEFRFELSNVSSEPGVCMNYPLESPSQEPDLRFETEPNESLNEMTATVVEQRRLRVMRFSPFTEGLTSAKGIVSSFDFGAFGDLRVSAIVPGHEPIFGFLKNDSQRRTTILLPQRGQGLYVADAWKKKPKINASGQADDSDSDNRPEGDGHAGDGYTLYEEYRGFSHKGEHIRTNPNEKDLFILDKVGHSEVKAGISMFEKASQLKVHGQLTKEEINEDNLMNFNRKSANRVAQHGLVIVGRRQHRGYSQSVGRNGDNNSTPGSKTQIELDPQGTHPLVEGQGLNLDGSGDWVTSGFAYDSVAHEIAHGCSVWHHGDCDKPKTKWRRGTNDVYDILESPGDILVDVVPERRSIGGLPYIVDADAVLEKYVGVPQGQHSGNATCIMRYEAAVVLRRDSSTRRILLDPLNAPGRTIFCRSPQGTHYNVAPRNLFGSAHAGRGNCARQICVNDLYIDSSVHNRDYPCEF